ncbi:uncharacterized protein LOC134329372 [Trichomycterus rosablanca]|uniref:uncharacterized protein LOC134329372 n=1 Tax=Trichomycterus rosablanca TaxID=2290929 RepID=UPI002F357FCF
MMFVEKSIRRLLVDVLGQSLSSVVPAHTGWSTCIHDNFTVAVGGLTRTLGRLVMESFKTSSGSSSISDVRTVSTKPGRSPTPACSALVRQPAGKIVQVSDTCVPDEVPAPVEKRGSGLPVIQANKAHKFILYLKRSNKVHPVCLESVSHQRSSSKDLQEGSRGTPAVSASSSKKFRRRLRGMFSALSEAVPNPFKHRPPPAE